MLTTSITAHETPLVLYALRRADDALILGHRLSEQVAHAPTLEEELALGNLGLDLIGLARSLYARAAEAESAGNTEDDYAYHRDAPAFRNLLLCELPDRDFATVIARVALYAAFADPYWRAMMGAGDAGLRDIAHKAEKETAYHLRYASEWLIRLGDGTAESARRAQDAVDWLWPYVAEMFDADVSERALIAAGAVADPASVRAAFDTTVDALLSRARLRRPADGFPQRGGRWGRHTEYLGHLLAPMQFLARTHPGAAW